MTDDRGQAPPLEERVPLRLTGHAKDLLQKHAGAKGTDSSKFLRKLLREALEGILTAECRKSIPHSKWQVHLCPACFAQLDAEWTGENGETEIIDWHIHEGVLVTGDMWW